MARADMINILYSQRRPGDEFNFDLLQGPQVLSLISNYDVQQITDICNDPRLYTKLEKRLELIDNIMLSRGFMRITQGTNRACYKYIQDQSFLFKIAISRPGFKDSYREYINQHKLKPFVTKCFDVVPNGIIGSFERVQDITSREQFMSVADQIFELLNNIFGKYVMADVGTRYFRNFGLRNGFGPVILDYPMLFEVDGNKLYCRALNYSTGMICDGEIDIDAGFNNLYCTKCGKIYLANELEKKVQNNEIQFNFVDPMRSERSSKMKIVIGLVGEHGVVEGSEKEIVSDISSSDLYIQNVKKITGTRGVVITDDGKTSADIKIDSKPVEDEKKIEAGDKIDINRYLNPSTPIPSVEEDIEEDVEDNEDLDEEEDFDNWVDVSDDILKEYIARQAELIRDSMEHVIESMLKNPKETSDLLALYFTTTLNSIESLVRVNETGQMPALDLPQEEDVPEEIPIEEEPSTEDIVPPPVMSNRIDESLAQTNEDLRKILYDKNKNNDDMSDF